MPTGSGAARLTRTTAPGRGVVCPDGPIARAGRLRQRCLGDTFDPPVPVPSQRATSEDPTVSTLRGRRPPRILLLVLVISLGLVALTGLGLTAVVGAHVESTALASSASADRALAQGFVESTLTADDMAVTPGSNARVDAIQSALRRLVASDRAILQLKVHTPDGTILFSDDPSLRGQVEGASELAEVVASGQPVAALEDESHAPAEGTGAGGGATADDHAAEAGAIEGPVVEEYLPVFAPDGSVEAIFEIYRDAAPLQAAIGGAQATVLGIMIATAVVLALVLSMLFRATQQRLDRQTEALVEATRRDALTGLLTHGAAVAALAERLEGARRARARGTAATVGVALVDIDNFRNLNETHGHAAGDRALVEVSRLLRDALPDGVILGRFGPDEFIAVTPPEPGHDIEAAIERIRDRLVGTSLQFGASERLPITISAGLCWYPVNGEAATELLSQATIALVEAKTSGGNAVRRAVSPEIEALTSQAASFDTLQGLILAVDARDRYTKRHSEDVARYALVLADQVGLDTDLRRPLHVAGLLHDVGKIGIPDTILRKPAALSSEEYEIVKQHVALGDAIVRDLPDIELVRAGIRSHHERWDGRGYLAGLAGSDIPLVGRILAVADAFSAMTTDRPYRKALPVEEAIRRLEDAAGGQLDPALVAAFVEVVRSIGPDMILARGPDAAHPAALLRPRVA